VRSRKNCVYALSFALIFIGAAALYGKPLRPGTSAPANAQVKIDNFAFMPAELTVAAGTTVEWVNQDDIPHTVVSDDKKTFKSKALDTDDKFSFTFNTPGTYNYFCSIHPKMTAKVIVQ
jgi:plastocyanin